MPGFVMDEILKYHADLNIYLALFVYSWYQKVAFFFSTLVHKVSIHAFFLSYERYGICSVFIQKI